MLAACVLAGGWVLCQARAPGKTGRDAKTSKDAKAQAGYKSPTCVAFSPDGRRAYVTNRTGASVSVIDAAAGKVAAEVRVGRRPTGVAVSPDGRWAYAANTADHSVSVIDARANKAVGSIQVGFEPTGLVVSPDGKRLYTANTISNDVSVVDTAARKQVARIPVGRAPTYLALAPDGKTLVVNNSLSHQPATDPKLTAHVSVIDTAAGKVIAEKRSGGTMLLGMGVAISADGQVAFAVHSRPNFNITPSQLGQGWVHTNALSIIPLAAGGKVITVLLDNVSSGMANPHGVALSKDGRRLFVSHRGVHQLSVVNLDALRALIKRTRPADLARAHLNLGYLWQYGGVVRRVGSGGLCPNALAVSPADGSVWVPNYFSDNVAVLDGMTGKLRRTIALGPPTKMTLVRRGEFLFHDGAHCFQQWLSCTSCHPDTRADGVNWDLLNDGRANPKNAKSLVGSWQTPPAMIRGVRASMEVAAEKGFLFIQFVQPTPDELEAVRAYLRSVPFIPSPFHRKADGSLDDQARRGRKVFARAGCAACHPPPLYTDMKKYDVRTRTMRDPKGTTYDTPTLLELYRTAPYLHDGRAATLEEVLTTYNPLDAHGTTSKLSKQELADLAAFLKAL